VLVPTNPDGSVIRNDSLTLEAELGASPNGTPLTFVSKGYETPDPRPVTAAVLLDDSQSMSRSDPDEERAGAARLFWQTVLAEAPNNQVSLLDFGNDRNPSPGFAETRLLQDWTADQNLLEAALSRVGPFDFTTLYESTTETLRWIDSTRPAPDNKRIVLVLTDGVPTDEDFAFKGDALRAAQETGIAIHTVGLAEASEIDDRADPTAVALLKELSGFNGGVYAPSPDAESLEPVFRTIADVAVQGRLLATFRIAPPVPTAGAQVAGTVTALFRDDDASAPFSFIVP
jgi:hypothetical protein